MVRTPQNTASSVADDVAAAEANLRAAQERLAAARQRAEQVNQCPPPAVHPSVNQAYTGRAERMDPRPNPYAQNVPEKDHIAAALFAIFLGAFGVHKFYMGLTQPGFITLAISIIGGVFSLGAACLVMALIGVVEGIIYLAKPQDKFISEYIVGKRAWF